MMTRKQDRLDLIYAVEKNYEGLWNAQEIHFYTVYDGSGVSPAEASTPPDGPNIGRIPPV